LIEPANEFDPMYVEYNGLESVEIEAVLISSVLENWLDAAVKVQAPVMVWFAEREAGPLV
jgi:hypothetical protein